MDLVESFRILRRRWILTLLMLALALGATAGAALKLPRTYAASSSVVLLASPNSSKANGGNPYLSFNGSLSPTGDVIRYEVMDPRTAQQLASEGYSASYLVADAIDTSGPVLLVTVTGRNKYLVEHTLSGVTAELGTKLQALQAGISPANRISILTLALGPAKLARSKLARPLVVILAFGLVLTFAVPLIIDAQLRRRRPPAAKPPRTRGQTANDAPAQPAFDRPRYHDRPRNVSYGRRP